MVVYKDENAYGFPRLVTSQSFVLIQGNSCMENRKFMYPWLEMHSVLPVCVGGRGREGREEAQMSLYNFPGNI